MRPSLDDGSEAGALISTAELSTILTAPPPNGTTIEMVTRMVSRVNNTLSGWNSGLLEPSEGSNMASFSIEFKNLLKTLTPIIRELWIKDSHHTLMLIILLLEN